MTSSQREDALAVNGVNLLPMVAVLAVLVVLTLIFVVRRRRKRHRRVDLTADSTLDMISNPMYQGSAGGKHKGLATGNTLDMVNNPLYQGGGNAKHAAYATTSHDRNGSAGPQGVWVNPSEPDYLPPQTLTSALDAGATTPAVVGMQQEYAALPPARPPKPIVMQEAYDALPPATQPPARVVVEDAYDGLPPALPVKARYLAASACCSGILTGGNLYQTPVSQDGKSVSAVAQGSGISRKLDAVAAEETYDLASPSSSAATQPVTAMEGIYGTAIITGRQAAVAAPDAELYDDATVHGEQRALPATEQQAAVCMPPATYDIATSDARSTALTAEQLDHRATSEGPSPATGGVFYDQVYDVATTKSHRAVHSADSTALYDVATAEDLVSAPHGSTASGATPQLRAHPPVTQEDMYDLGSAGQSDSVLVAENRFATASSATRHPPVMMLEDMYDLASSTTDSWCAVDGAAMGLPAGPNSSEQAASATVGQHQAIRMEGLSDLGSI